MTTAIKLGELLDVRSGHLDETRVRDFAGRLDHMPPVVVFQTPDGLLLADGYHRVAAARLLGRTEIAADVREGTKTDAMKYAIDNAVASGIPPEQASAAIEKWRYK